MSFRSNAPGSGLARGLGWLTAALLLLFSAGTAHAEFGNCAASGFLSGVDDRMAGTALACDEAVRFTISTPAGPRDVRIIYSTDDLSPGLLDFVSEIRRGIEQSAAALRAIGEGGPSDITIWAADLPSPGDAADAFDGQTRPLRGPRSECVIALYPGGETAFITAHEFFHCVQFATVGDKTNLVASTWWVEGTAEWFANRAIPASGNSAGDVSLFDATSADVPLTSMSQESVVFFFWLDQNFGGSMAMALMGAMPAGGGASAQQDALAGFLSEDDFLRFAQDYLDRQIRQPGGGTIPSNPFPGNIYVWSETHEHTLRADRFVLARFQMEVACGSWSVSRDEENGLWRVSKDEGPWEDLPEHLDISGPDPELRRIAGFGTGSDGFSVDLELERDPCRQCQVALAADDPAACLIGTWTLASGGYGEQIQERLRESGLFESMTYPDMESVLVINPDGTYSMPGPAEGYNTEVRTPGGDLFVGLGTLSMQSGGHWSVDGDTLTLCEIASRVDIDLTIIDPDGNSDRFVESGGPDSHPIQRERDYTCSDSALTLVEDIPFTPTVTWNYTR